MAYLNGGNSDPLAPKELHNILPLTPKIVNDLHDRDLAANPVIAEGLGLFLNRIGDLNHNLEELRKLFEEEARDIAVEPSTAGPPEMAAAAKLVFLARQSTKEFLSYQQPLLEIAAAKIQAFSDRCLSLCPTAKPHRETLIGLFSYASDPDTFDGLKLYVQTLNNSGAYMGLLNTHIEVSLIQAYGALSHIQDKLERIYIAPAAKLHPATAPAHTLAETIATINALSLEERAQRNFKSMHECVIKIGHIAVWADSLTVDDNMSSPLRKIAACVATAIEQTSEIGEWEDKCSRLYTIHKRLFETTDEIKQAMDNSGPAIAELLEKIAPIVPLLTELEQAIRDTPISWDSHEEGIIRGMDSSLKEAKNTLMVNGLLAKIDGRPLPQAIEDWVIDASPLANRPAIDTNVTPKGWER